MFEDINWHTGMLLKPQHFQLIKYCNFYKSIKIIGQSYSFFWGIIDLKLNFSKISSGLIVVESISAVFQNGEIVEYDINDSFVGGNIFNLDINLAERDLKDGEITVFLAINQNHEKQATQPGGTYLVSHGPIEDEDQHEKASFVFIQKIKPKLLLENEIMPSNSIIPIVRINKSGEVFSIKPFIGPRFLLNKDLFIVKDIMFTIGQIEGKLKETEKQIQMAIKQKQLDFETIINIKNADSIRICILELKRLIENTHIKPFEVYCKLDNLMILVLSAANSDQIESPKYRHQEASDIISAQIKVIERNLQYILNVLVRFELFQKIHQNEFQCSISTEFITQDKIYIQIQAEAGENITRRELEEAYNRFAIYSKKFEQEIKKLRIKGVNRELITRIKNVSQFSSVGEADDGCFLSIEINGNYFDINSPLIIDLGQKLGAKCQCNIIYSQKT